VSSLLIRLSALWKHREILLTVSGIVLMVGYMILMMNMGQITGDTADGGEMIRQLVESSSARIGAMTKIFPPAAWAANGMLGQNYGMFVVWILLSLAAPAITVWLLGYSYRKLSMLQTETPGSGKKKLTGKESYTGGSQLKACCMREIKTILRVPSYATNILPICFMPLMMAIMILVVGGKNAGESGGFLALFQKMPEVIVMGILAAVLAYMSGMNPALSTAVTREGKGHDFLTALPVSPHTFICAKFIVGFSLSVLGVLAAAVALFFFFPGFETPIVLAFVLSVLFCFVNATLALSRDIKKPRLDWVTEQEAVKQNFGVLISMLISWGILLILAALAYLLIDKCAMGMVPLFAILAAILAAMCVGAYILLRRTTEKYYCAG